MSTSTLCIRSNNNSRIGPRRGESNSRVSESWGALLITMAPSIKNVLIASAAAISSCKNKLQSKYLGAKSGAQAIAGSCLGALKATMSSSTKRVQCWSGQVITSSLSSSATLNGDKSAGTSLSIKRFSWVSDTRQSSHKQLSRSHR